MGFRYLDNGPPADLMVEAWGKTLGETFAQMATAMFNAMTPIKGIKEKEARSIEVEGDDLEALLFNFLDELLYIHDVYLIVLSSFSVDVDCDKLKLKAICYGEPMDLNRHSQGIEIKAVTFNSMRIQKGHNIWKIRVVFDT